MSSPDRTADTRRRPSLGLALVVALAAAGLTGCGADIHPLYGSLGNGGSGPETTEALRHVDVGVIGGRVGQQIRNDLVFGFYGGEGDVAKPARYRLDITVTESANAVGIERYHNLPSAYLLQMSAAWVVSENATGHTLASGTAYAQAAYDISQQRYAAVRAQRDAENRAASVIASDIRTKVAVHFATHR